MRPPLHVALTIGGPAARFVVMRRLRAPVAIGLLLLWGMVTVHCGLEVDGLLFKVQPAHAATSASDHPPLSTDTDPDGCAAIESGHFESFVASFVIACPAADGWIHRTELRAQPLLAIGKSPLEFGPPPLELAPTWAFDRRTALSPRAPSLAS